MEKISQCLSKGSPGVFIRIIQMNSAGDGHQGIQDKLKLHNKCGEKKCKLKTTVKKFGKITEVKIDEERNTQQQNEIREILKKDQCMDIFKEAVIDREN